VCLAKSDERVGLQRACARDASFTASRASERAPTSAGAMRETHLLRVKQEKATVSLAKSDERVGLKRACARDASFKLRGASARHPLQHLSGLRGDLVLAQHLVLRSDRLGH
jgi:hypothetical protein